MNERIRELVERATTKISFRIDPTTYKYIEDPHGNIGQSIFDKEKFAELIVKECAEVAGCNAHVSGFALGDLIKEHFGVEE